MLRYALHDVLLERFFNKTATGWAQAGANTTVIVGYAFTAAGRFFLSLVPMPLATGAGLTAATVNGFPNPAHEPADVLLPAIGGARQQRRRPRTSAACPLAYTPCASQPGRPWSPSRLSSASLSAGDCSRLSALFSL